MAICRQIQYEIGETYTEMADLKISLTEHQGIDTVLCRKNDVIESCVMTSF